LLRRRRRTGWVRGAQGPARPARCDYPRRYAGAGGRRSDWGRARGARLQVRPLARWTAAEDAVAPVRRWGDDRFILPLEARHTGARGSSDTPATTPAARASRPPPSGFKTRTLMAGGVLLRWMGEAAAEAVRRALKVHVQPGKSRKSVCTPIDGLEHRRAPRRGAGRWYAQFEKREGHGRAAAVRASQVRPTRQPTQVPPAGPQVSPTSVPRVPRGVQDRRILGECEHSLRPFSVAKTTKTRSESAGVTPRRVSRAP